MSTKFEFDFTIKICVKMLTDSWTDSKTNEQPQYTYARVVCAIL